ncbi:MAG: chorismate mutase, partial [Crenarchaeota archaeon]|nr:chorismate mutase [Thermoproteota archaeon]
AKRRAGKPVRDPTREKQVLERAGRFRRVFEAIIELCIREQGG